MDNCATMGYENSQSDPEPAAAVSIVKKNPCAHSQARQRLGVVQDLNHILRIK